MKKEKLKLTITKQTIATLSKNEMNVTKGGFLSLWNCKGDDITRCPLPETHPIPEKSGAC